MIPVQRKIFPRGSPRAQYIVGTRYTCHIFSGEQDVQHTQHTEPAKLRHYLYLLDTLQQFVPAGTAVLNQQDWRRASDRGRAIHVHSKYSSSSTCSSRLFRYFSNYIMYIISGTAVYNGTSGCWRAKVGERQRASDMYVNSNTAIPAVLSTLFSVNRIHISSLAPVRFYFILFTTRAKFSAAASE